MDRKVAWSPEAVEDVEAIAQYIARDSDYYARMVVTDILAVSRSLGQFPFMGRIVPEFGVEAVRERLVHSFRLVYRVEVDRVLVVAVIHGRRRLEHIEGRIDESD